MLRSLLCATGTPGRVRVAGANRFYLHQNSWCRKAGRYQAPQFSSFFDSSHMNANR